MSGKTKKNENGSITGAEQRVDAKGLIAKIYMRKGGRVYGAPPVNREPDKLNRFMGKN